MRTVDFLCYRDFKIIIVIMAITAIIVIYDISMNKQIPRLISRYIRNSSALPVFPTYKWFDAHIRAFVI